MKTWKPDSCLTTVPVNRSVARMGCVALAICLAAFANPLLGQCTVPTAGAPSSFPATDVVWFDDDVPQGAEVTENWNWDTTQKASGTQSHHDPSATEFHGHHVWDPNSTFYIAATDSLVTYVLVDPCDPPQEIMLEWHAGETGWEHRAFWGADLIDQGTPGTPSRVSMGALPTAGQWIRLSIPASTLDLGSRTLYGMSFHLYGGHAWFDRSGKTVTCTPPIAALPTIPSGETVFFDDSLPEGAEQSGTWDWDTTQKASGSQSHTAPSQAGPSDRHVWHPSSMFYIAATDALVTYILVDPCDPPQEIMLEWHAGETGWEHRAFWGQDLIDLGTPGTPSRVSMGVLPTAGQWIRISIPAGTLDLGGRTLYGMSFHLYGGHAWFDRSGKSATCAPPIAGPPTIPPGETVWIDDNLPAGVEQGGTWDWDTTQKASGTQSHHEPAVTGLYEHYFVEWSSTFYVAATDTLITYVLVDPCDPPQEIMLQWFDGSWEHRAFWGQDLIDRGASGTPSRVSMGALPTAGQWIRLSIPASTVDLAGRTLFAMAFDLYGGHAWFDRSGKVNPNVATALRALDGQPTRGPRRHVRDRHGHIDGPGPGRRNCGFALEL